MNGCRLFAGAMLLCLPVHICAQEKPKKIDKAAIAAWEKRGFVTGWMGGREGELTFEVDPAMLDGGVPAFRATQSKAVENAKSLPALEVAFGLDLHFPATDAVVKELAPLTNLARLILNGRGALVSGVTDGGLKELVALKSLTHLDLKKNPVTDAGVKELSALTNLAHLSLHGTKVTGVGVKELAALKNLTSLDLSGVSPLGSGVTDAALKELSPFKSLSHLDLSQTRVTDAGLKDLAALKTLSTLNLSGTRVTDAGVKELQKALPKCKIFR